MQIIGKNVTHKSFGHGKVTDVSNGIATVAFGEMEKRFFYPDAFTKYLTLSDLRLQGEMDSIIDRIKEEKNEALARETEKKERVARIRTMRISPKSQAAFHISCDELEKIMAEGAISTGVYLSGYSKGEPRVPSRIRPNSVCLLTGLPGQASEKDRKIFGAMMVHEDFWGDCCRDGLVIGHEVYRIRLAEDQYLPYWRYFGPKKIIEKWGNIPFQYFENTVMRQILSDMENLLAGSEVGKLAKNFLRYFCEVNRLPRQLSNTDQDAKSHIVE